MSTNFYLTPDGVEDPDDARSLHILKRSNGYIIRAHHESPFGEIASWAAWHDILADMPQGWTLRDEYRSTHTTPADLIAEVEEFTRDDRRRYARWQNHYVNMANGRVVPIGGPDTAWTHTGDTLRDRWLDAEGYYVSGHEFC